ncbi:unnamed protein product [Echinostoma caproni]|uniref:Coenzyme F420 hydrogenase n=1 Tax=Echinostoma caproni TaxID=27848 RepID=A0A182ZZB4_9TREM|nr:unnamed protein product [Echinostoma caproni]
MKQVIRIDQIIMAPSPLIVFEEYKQKRALFIGQEGTLHIAHSLGFVNAITLEEVKAAYPLLDMVDHDNRKRMAKGVPEAKPVGKIDVIILIGEPTHWEANLQLLIDILLTNGKPDHMPSTWPEKHIPVIACNMDLVFMDRAVLPRFGHGAFLTCLEALYRNFTGRELQYTSLLGKPSEITFRFAEHIVNVMAHRIGYTKPIEHLYFFGYVLSCFFSQNIPI